MSRTVFRKQFSNADICTITRHRPLSSAVKSCLDMWLVLRGRHMRTKYCLSVHRVWLKNVTWYCLGLGRFDHFHFRFGFGQFLTKNRGLGFTRFGFRTLTATFTSRLQSTGVDVASPYALLWQPAFASLVAWCRMSWLETSLSHRWTAQPCVRYYRTSYSLPTQAPVSYTHLTLPTIYSV